MEENREYTLRMQPLSAVANNENQYKFIKEENERLRSENSALKKDLQKEKTLHQLLYNQWNELNTGVTDKVRELVQIKLKQNPRRNFYKYAFYALLGITVLLITLNFSSHSNKENTIPNDAVLVSPLDKDSISKITGTVTEPQATSSDLTGTISGKDDPVQSNLTSAKSIPADPPQVNKISPLAPAESNSPVTKGASRYVVKAKSYFHNEPDPNTRRNTFVLPWEGEYGILNALDDKNGFIYIVFKNHAGRISKGWILKSDLEPVKP